MPICDGCSSKAIISYICKSTYISQKYYKILKRTICIAVALLSCFNFGAAGASDARLGLTTVVIDAGHGGKDPGAISKDGKTREKDITLEIAESLSARIRESYPDVKVLMTRSSDRFISLNDRAEKANKAGANLFISIHINAAPNVKANGYSIHLMGQSTKKDRDLYEYNMNVCKRENSVILLEDDYTTKYEGFDPNDPESYIFMQLMQNAHLEQSMNFAGIVKKHLKGGPISADRGIWQDPFYVLWKTAMPAILVELGFITNSSDLAQLRSGENRKELARRLYEAFVEYKQSYDKSVAVDTTQVLAPAGKDSVAESSSKAEETPVLYGVQILAGGNLLPAKSREFMGYQPKIIKAGRIYRYIIAVSADESETRADFPAIKKKYPDAFLVKISGESTSRLQ